MKVPILLDIRAMRRRNPGGVIELADFGFLWDIEHWRGDKLLSHERDLHNLMPTEGLNYVLEAAVRGGTQYSSWYVGLFEANYTPLAADTAATFPGSATESTAYSESARQAYTTVAASGGVLTNTASKATFTMNATKTIYGGFISSASAKSATTGKLLSAAKFSTSKAVESGDVLNITATITATSS